MGLFNYAPANRALDRQGQPVAGAVRHIYPLGSVSPAQVFRDFDLTLMRSSDMTSDEQGYFELCYLQDGLYRVEIFSPQAPYGPPLYEASPIEVGPVEQRVLPRVYETVDQLRADPMLCYEDRAGGLRISPGALLEIAAQGLQVRVLDPAQGGAHLVTAGGVKFCEAGPHYTTEARFIDAVARGEQFCPGMTVTAGGASFVYGGPGTGAPPQLPGWTRILSPGSEAELQDIKRKADWLTVGQPVNLDLLPGLAAGANTYDSVAAGLAATDPGAAFFVALTPGLLMYRNEAGAAVPVGWQGDVAFDDVSHLRANLLALPEGRLLRTRAEGYCYRVAAPQAVDHHVTLGGTKLYILPQQGVLDFGAWGGDATGETDRSRDLEQALFLAVALALPLRLPPGRFRLSRRIIFTLPPATRLRICSEGGSTLHLATKQSLHFRATGGPVTVLAADAARRDRYLELGDASGLETGDLLHILAPNTAVETGWNYPKNCVRRVVAREGNRVQLDQALDFFFTTAEDTTVSGFRPAYLHMSGIDFQFEDFAAVNFKNISGLIEKASAVGSTDGWASGAYCDGFMTTTCDQFTYDHVVFRMFRYCPMIQMGSRNIQVRNFRVERIRHLDASGWSQDILFENGQGIHTDGILQCHPTLRPVFRNVHDSVTGGLMGLDLRGMGEVVENCSSTSDATTPGTNTNAPVLVEAYRDMAAEMQRTIRRFRSPVTGIKGGPEGTLLIEACDVPYIGASEGHSNQTQKVIVDTATRLSAPQDPTRRRAFNNVVSALPGPVRIAASPGFCPVGEAFAITAISRSNPAVVTSPGHRLIAGDRLRLAGTGSMTQLEGKEFVAGSVTADSFVLNSATSGAGINSTAYAPYDGTATGLRLPTPRPILGLQASPLRLTVVGHGLSEGDPVCLQGLAGATALNGRILVSRDVAGDSFGLIDPATGQPPELDMAYGGGGTVTRLFEATVLDATTAPALGFGTKLWMVSTVHEERASPYPARPVRRRIKIRDMAGGQVDQSDRHGRIRARMLTPLGLVEISRSFRFSYVRSMVLSEPQLLSAPLGATSGLSLAIRHVELHGMGQVGRSGADWLSPASNEQYHWSFDLEMTSPPGAAGQIRTAEVELEAWRLT